MQGMDRQNVYCKTVCNIIYMENLVRVIQRLTPPSVHSRAEEIIISFSSGGIHYGKTWEFFKNHVNKILGTRSIIGDGWKPEAMVF